MERINAINIRLRVERIFFNLSELAYISKYILLQSKPAFDEVESSLASLFLEDFFIN